jgi:formylglycine-generating enzyme required for sulfatase activity
MALEIPLPDVRMVHIPAGAITLRDDRLKRSWHVEIPAFQMAIQPVTQRLYAAMTGAWPAARIEAECPIEGVSWMDAVRFCNQLSVTQGLEPAYAIDVESLDATYTGSNGYRLPTEGEWEYACRATTSGPRYGALDDIAWYAGNSGGRHHPVGLRAPNAWGLHDMLGNVWEWCFDQYDVEVYGPYRIFRGGGWADDERGCFATNRRRSHPTFSIDDLGFRIARSLVA